MKNKKAILSMVLVMLMVVSFASCQKSGTEVKKVGITQISDHPSLDNCREGFIEGLKQSGYEEGKNLKIDYQSATGDSAIQNTITQSFVSNGVDLICAISTPSALSAYNAAMNKNIPVVFTAISDPVSVKLATSETKAIENICGSCDILPVESQLKLIRALLPEAKKIGILYNTGEANSISQIKVYKSLASKYNFEIVESGVSSGEDIPLAIDRLLTKVDAITNLTDNLVVSNLAILIEKANKVKIPVFGSEEEQVTNGCLASEGIDYYQLGVETGKMAAKVLSGEDINSMEILRFSESVLYVNKDVMNTLGITLPKDLVERVNYTK